MLRTRFVTYSFWLNLVKLTNTEIELLIHRTFKKNSLFSNTKISNFSRNSNIESVETIQFVFDLIWSTYLDQIYFVFTRSNILNDDSIRNIYHTYKYFKISLDFLRILCSSIKNEFFVPGLQKTTKFNKIIKTKTHSCRFRIKFDKYWNKAGTWSISYSFRLKLINLTRIGCHLISFHHNFTGFY